MYHTRSRDEFRTFTPREGEISDDRPNGGDDRGGDDRGRPRAAAAGGGRQAGSGGPEASPESGALKRAYLIRGRVQGVGFRWWSRRMASELGLAGTVRNRPDGTVELHVRGDRASVETMESRIREGPPSARVEGVEQVEPREDLPAGFRILR